MADDAEHMSLFAIVIDGTAQGLAVDSQGAVTAAIGLMPCAQGGVELVGFDADAPRRACKERPGERVS